MIRNLILLVVSIVSFNTITNANAKDLNEGDEDRIQAGGVCFRSPGVKTSTVLSQLRARGLALKTNNDLCVYVGDDYTGIDVPEGLEAWTLKTLRQLGYDDVSNVFMTAGGGGENKNLIDSDDILLGEVTPNNFDSVIGDLTCKLDKRFRTYFSEVNLQGKCKSDVRKGELCWNIWLAGHSSNSKVINRSKLENKIENKYWFSTRLELFMGIFDEYPGEYDRPTKYGQVRIDYFVVSTKFARSPVNIIPAPSKYRSIDSFDPTIDADEVDGLIGQSLRNVIHAGKFIC